MNVVMFFGPDGAGKTTLAQALAKEISERGFKVKVEWMRGTHTIASILARFLSRFESFKGMDNPYYEISIPSKMRSLWRIIEFVSFIPIIVFRLLLPGALGRLVIAERSPVDFVVWVSLVTRDPGYIEGRQARFLLSLKALIKIYITCNIDAIRWRRRGDLEAMMMQANAYNRVSLLSKTYTLDTTKKSKEESLSELRVLVHEELSRIWESFRPILAD